MVLFVAVLLGLGLFGVYGKYRETYAELVREAEYRRRATEYAETLKIELDKFDPFLSALVPGGRHYGSADELKCAYEALSKFAELASNEYGKRWADGVNHHKNLRSKLVCLPLSMYPEINMNY